MECVDGHVECIDKEMTNGLADTVDHLTEWLPLDVENYQCSNECYHSSDNEEDRVGCQRGCHRPHGPCDVGSGCTNCLARFGERRASSAAELLQLVANHHGTQANRVHSTARPSKL